MPDLGHQLTTYFDALADQIDDHAAVREPVDVHVGVDIALVDGEAKPIELTDELVWRRPRAILAVALVALALGIAGIIAWTASEDPLTVELGTTDPTATTEPETEPADGSSVVVVGGEPDGVWGLDWSGEWHGGTATLETVRVLGPAPEDVLERYPPEIQELWADGLPTWEQAESELQAAGLGQLGFETAENDLVLREWFLGATGRTTLTHTVDGVATTIPLDAEYDGSVAVIESAASDGERLAVAGQGLGPYVGLSVTEDLETWTNFELVSQTPPGVPAGFVMAPNNPEVSVSEWGWIVTGSPQLVGVDTDALVSLGLLGP